MLDVLGFGLLALATVFVSQFATRKFEISLSIPAGPFKVAGRLAGVANRLDQLVLFHGAAPFDF